MSAATKKEQGEAKKMQYLCVNMGFDLNADVPKLEASLVSKELYFGTAGFEIKEIVDCKPAGVLTTDIFRAWVAKVKEDDKKKIVTHEEPIETQSERSRPYATLERARQKQHRFLEGPAAADPNTTWVHVIVLVCQN